MEGKEVIWDGEAAKARVLRRRVGYGQTLGVVVLFASDWELGLVPVVGRGGQLSLSLELR
jgi:hypothetical protein